MTDLILSSNTDSITVSTLDLLHWVNDARARHGEPVLRRNVFHARVVDELDGDHYKKIVVRNSNNTTTEAFELNQEQSMLVAMRESKGVRRSVIEKLKAMERSSQPQLPQSLPEALRLAADMAEKNQQLALENQQQAVQIESLQNLFVDGMTPSEFAKRLNGVNCQKINQRLLQVNWLYQDFRGGWRVSSYARDRYLTERQSNIQHNSGLVTVACTPILLRKGAIQIHKAYLAGELPMKRTWDGQFTHDKAIEKVA